MEENAAKKIFSLPTERSNRASGTDELNLCEFPLSSIGRATGNQGTTLVFEDDIFDEGSKQQVHRKLVVSGSEAFGLPTAADSDVLLSIIKATDLMNGFTSPMVPFTRYEILKILHWDQSGKSYKRLDESLRRWANITLNYVRAWWDKDGQKWQSRSFHILEAIDLRGRGDGSDDGSSSFTWNKVIFDSFQSKNVKPLNLDVVFQLKSPAAKQAYRFLDKRFYRTRFLEFDLRTFACEHVGFSRTHDNGQLKRKLQPAIQELEAIKFLKPMTLAERYLKRQRGEWIIRLIREADAADNVNSESLPEPQSIATELIDFGINNNIARELVSEFSEERIREKIGLLKWLTAKGDSRKPKNPAGWLAAAIREDYRPPSDYKGVELRSPAPPVSRPSVPRTQNVSGAQDAKLSQAKSFFESLSAEEQLRIEDLALQTGNRFRVETYHRLKETGGHLLQEMRDVLVADLLERSGAESIVAKDKV